MKLDEKNQTKGPQNEQKTSLWKKIGKAPKTDNYVSEQPQSYRFDTSIQLQLLAEQKDCNKQNIFHIQGGISQKSLSESFWAEGEDIQFPISAQKIKIAELIYKIQTTDQILQPMVGNVPKIKNPKTNFFVSLNEQIKLLINDYDNFKKQIAETLKNFWEKICIFIKEQQLSKCKQKMEDRKILTEQLLASKLKTIKGLEDRLLYIQKESNIKKSLISIKEVELLILKEETVVLEKAYSNLKFSIKTEKKKNSLTIDAEQIFFENKRNSLTPRSSGIDKKSQLSDESFQSDNISKSLRMNRLKSSQEISQLKTKIHGLKMKISKTGSLIQ